MYLVSFSNWGRKAVVFCDRELIIAFQDVFVTEMYVGRTLMKGVRTKLHA